MKLFIFLILVICGVSLYAEEMPPIEDGFGIQNAETIKHLDNKFLGNATKTSQLTSQIKSFKIIGDIRNIATDSEDAFLLHWLYVLDNQNIRLEEIEWFLTEYTNYDIPLKDKIIKKGNEIVSDDKPNSKRALRWYSGFSPDTFEKINFLKNKAKSNGNALSGNFEKISNLLWQNNTTNATKKLIINSKLDKNDKLALLVRFYLQTSNKSYISYLSQLPVPAAYRDEGLLYDFINYLLSQNDYEHVLPLIKFIPDKSYYEDEWWTLKKRIAFTLLRSVNGSLKESDPIYLKIYNLVSQHQFISKDKDITGVEWLSGLIAVEFLGKADLAIKHFLKAYQQSNYAKFRSKLCYWLAHSYKIQQNEADYEIWIKRAMEYPSTYYGQVALFEFSGLNLSEFYNNFTSNHHSYDNPHAIKNLMLIDRLLTNYQGMLGQYRTLDPESFDKLLNNYLINTSIKLINLGYYEYAKEFLITYLKSSENKTETILMLNVFSRYLPIKVYKKVLSEADLRDLILKDKLLLQYRYKLIPLGGLQDPNLYPLIYSIIYRESGFEIDATSNVGALGLMQLMPSTAKEITRSIGIGFNHKRLISDPEYNVKLGSFYIKRLLNLYQNNPILAVAAYNAGSGNVNRWLKQTPFPQSNNIHDIIRWVELIPFSETRHYVTMVLSTEVMYRYLLWKRIQERSLSATENTDYFSINTDEQLQIPNLTKAPQTLSN